MRNFRIALVAVACATASMSVNAACWDVSYSTLKNAANDVVDAGTTGGFSLPSWATMVDETGKVCHVVSTGETTGAQSGNSQWLGSRVISAQKANTANAFSLDGVSISTGALFAAVQPGASLYGLQHSNPVDASRAYKGSPNRYGKSNDPLKGKRIGGVNVFGGGIALYDDSGVKIGAIGVSGDTSCADHANAWKIREALGLDNTPAGDFEKLTITNVYANIGDHGACPNDADSNKAEHGFNI
ncbi:MAG: GlcG/HbpS family heme-binding protein [Methylophilaceae bacterium]